MLFHLSDFLLDSPIYAVYLYREISEKEYLQICGIIRYYCRKDNVNWLAIFSTTESKSAELKYIKKVNEVDQKNRFLEKKLPVILILALRAKKKNLHIKQRKL